MKKTILLGTAVATLALFSCGETQSPEDMEAQMTEIMEEQAAQDEMDAIKEEIDEAAMELENSLETL